MEQWEGEGAGDCLLKSKVRGGGEEKRKNLISATGGNFKLENNVCMLPILLLLGVGMLCSWWGGGRSAGLIL